MTEVSAEHLEALAKALHDIDEGRGGPFDPMLWWGVCGSRPGRADIFRDRARAVMRADRCGYIIEKPETGWREKTSFSDTEKAKLMPIAETLAMLDGNAFFGDHPPHDTWYEGYLSEASALYDSNGGDNGWAGEASFAKNRRFSVEKP